MNFLSLTAILLIISGNLFAAPEPFKIFDDPYINGRNISLDSSPDGICLALGFKNGFVEGSLEESWPGHTIERTIHINEQGEIIKLYAAKRHWVHSIACWK